MYRLSPVGAAKPTPAVFVGLRNLPQSSNSSAAYLSAYAASRSLREPTHPTETLLISLPEQTASFHKAPKHARTEMKDGLVALLTWPFVERF